MRSFGSPAIWLLAALAAAALLVGGGGNTRVDAFQPARRFPAKQGAGAAAGGFSRDDRHRSEGYYSFGGIDTTTPNARCDRSVRLSAGFLDDIQGFFKRFTTRASASHILIKGGAEAANKLEDLKAEIGESPVAFATAATRFSECPSSSRGGDLGSFGPGAMVKEFDAVVFGEDVGVVHGPIKTQFGYHLIYVRERTE